jgi:hypothetical protein
LLHLIETGYLQPNSNEIVNHAKGKESLEGSFNFCVVHVTE